MRKILICLYFLILISTYQIYAGTIYYVSQNGNDNNPGTEFIPWQTIQKAADTMKAGETVIVNAGEYQERVSINTSGDSNSFITYRANGEVKLQGFNIYAGYIKIDGFTVKATECTWNEKATGIWVEGSNCIIENNYAYYCPRVGIIITYKSHNCTIKNNRCERNGTAGIEIHGSNHLIINNEVWGSIAYHPPTGCTNDADGMRFFGSGHIFRGNYIHDISYDDPNNQVQIPHIDAFQTWSTKNDSAGTDITFEQNWIDLLTDNGDNVTGVGWMLENASNIIIANNVIRAFWGINTGGGGNSNLTIINNLFINDLSSNASLWPSGIGLENVYGCLIKNNIFYDITDEQISISGSSGLEIDYNCAYRSDGVIPYSDGAPNSHDLWGINPKFVNALEDDFHLKSDSPCIDAGTSLSEVTDDYEGNSRPQGEGYDIGAYEYSSMNPPLSASVSGSPTSGDAPLTVSFSGEASGGNSPYYYSWDFGDGSSSSKQNPEHTYSQAGAYTASLTVTDSNDNQASDSITITVSTLALSASSSASPTSGQVPLSINFTANASGGTSPYSYSWNFGNGKSSSSQNPSHTYSQAGTYSVTLTVTDSKSSQASDSLTITASAPPLSASVSASPTSGEVPLTVNFIASSNGGISPYSYSWSFDDGSSSSDQNPSHTYFQAGTYSATLTVTDSNSDQVSDSLNITATEPVSPLSASASASLTSGEVPLTVNFTGSASGGSSPYSYSWDFGDGSSSSEQNPSHTYSNAGSYTVSLTVTDSNSNQVSDSLTITASATANFNLKLSSVTGSPAPGEGGTTNPSPGNHSYSVGSSAQAKAIPNTNYRFSKWTGDINNSDAYKKDISITLDKNKAITAHFFTKCGDVNGDLNISPADAQAAFDIYLGRITSPTESEKENADVNCSGTQTGPNITPADAQAIFDKYLGRNELPCDCSCGSRTVSVSTKMRQAQNVNLIINDVQVNLSEEISIPIIIDNPFNMKAFGFDLLFPSEILEFVGVEKTEFQKDFNQLDANKIADGMLRVGGYSKTAIRDYFPRVLITLIFKVTGELKEPTSFVIINTVDDVKHASVKNGMIIK